MKITMALLALLSGCATATKLNTGDGTIYRVDCDGSAVPLSACYTKANQICPAGWDQIGKDGTLMPQGVATPDVAVIGVYERKSITVKCR